MMLKLKHHILFFSLFFSVSLGSLAQSLPVGNAALMDALRRAQLLGEIDSSLSFTSFPLFPVEALKVNNSYDPFNSIEEHRLMGNDGILHFAGRQGRIQLLPITWQQQFNTHHPYSLNDGAMIPARGYQTLISAGLFAKMGPLSITFQPEYLYAENRNFKGFPTEYSDKIWSEYYRMHNNIDLPERFGEGTYQKKLWGQSCVRLTAGPLSLGLSNENLWWGPGIKNSLMMSNSAQGFGHITLNTVKPIKTGIGSFEGQIIGGRLEDSGFTPPDTTRSINSYQLYRPKRDDWRYINGMVISYHPKWVPGLFLGATRSFMTYHKDMGDSFQDYLPILTPFDKKANYGENESSVPGDQRASGFIRWLWLKAQAELYAEYFREDHAYDLRDMILQIEHTHAYLFGMQKMVPLNKGNNQFIHFHVEVTKLEQTTTNPERPSHYIYYHTAGIYHGYTNVGQLIGSGIGPGSNLFSLQVSWVKSMKKIGLEVERYVHNNDLHNATIRDPRANWVDLGINAIGNWDWKNLLFSAKFQFINSYNYQHNYQQVNDSENNYWIPGKNTLNFQAQVSTTYRF